MAVQCQCMIQRYNAERLTIEILEVGQLNALPHAQNVGGSAEAVEHHPEVTSMQSRHGVVGGLGSLSETA
jgi:hypothetical protein